MTDPQYNHNTKSKLSGSKVEPEIIFEDEYLIAINKPAGMLSAPGRKPDEKDARTTLEAIKDQKLFTCHRLDRDTSGVLLLSKTAEAHKLINLQFSEGNTRKTYLAISGKTKTAKDLPEKISLPLSPKPNRHSHRVELDFLKGRSATTEFTLLKTSPWPKDLTLKSASQKVCGQASEIHKPEIFLPEICLIEARPITGKTHQIRAHLELAGFPIILDHLYGPWSASQVSSANKNQSAGEGADVDVDVDADVGVDAVEGEGALCHRMLLHALKLKFTHPMSSKPLELNADLPADFSNTQKALGLLST